MTLPPTTPRKDGLTQTTSPRAFKVHLLSYLTTQHTRKDASAGIHRQEMELPTSEQEAEQERDVRLA